MLYFLSLTRKCNLKCRYCGEGSSITVKRQEIFDSNIQAVIDFLSNDPEPIIAFYGGEPLLKRPLMYEVMDRLPDAKFLLQTNGLLLDKVNTNYLNSMDTILVSIDGPQQITDFNRGTGTFVAIRKSIMNIINRGFKGDLIARMTISHKGEIYRDVNYLLNMNSPKFNHVHWQLDAIWGDLDAWNGFDTWVNAQYNPGITKLIQDWVERIKTYGRVPGIVPFTAIMNNLLADSIIELHCGAGIDAFAIHTNGKIYACPVCPEFEDFIVGDVRKSQPMDIYRSKLIKEPCIGCDVYSVCGGRCLFANYHNYWGEGFKSVCSTVKHLITELKGVKPEILKLINQGVISRNDFEYPSFNNTCEIIP